VCAKGGHYGPVTHSPLNAFARIVPGLRRKTSFCTTHECIPSFDEGNGSIVKCEDGEWSHSGGLPGACSWHGGETDVTAR
jgi:hypothetical protein